VFLHGVWPRTVANGLPVGLEPAADPGKAEARRGSARTGVGPTDRNGSPGLYLGRHASSVWSVAVGGSVGTSGGPLHRRGLYFAGEWDAPMPRRGEFVVERSPSRERVYESLPSTSPDLSDCLSCALREQCLDPGAKGNRAGQRQCGSTASACACHCGAHPRRAWADAVGGRGRSSAAPHLDGSLASAIRGDPSPG
jgi:hypothetical protein